MGLRLVHRKNAGLTGRGGARVATRGTGVLVSSLHLNLASALVQQGNLTEAVEEYRQAIRVNPNNPAAHYQLGTTLSELGWRDEAIEAYRRTLQLDPQHAAARAALSAALAEQRRAGP